MFCWHGMWEKGAVSLLLLSLLWSFWDRTAYGGGLPRYEKIVAFSGYTWEVKEGYYHPGKNRWSKENVWVDEEGRLHLLLTYQGHGWYCAEVRSTQLFDYGHYRFQVISSLDKFDPQVVLGLFLYDETTQDEIDIEFSRWGQPSQPNGIYSIYGTKGKIQSHFFQFTLPDGEYSTHQIHWLPQNILFSSQYGHRTNEEWTFSSWQYNRSEGGQFPQKPMRLHMNLWLYKGKPPQNKQVTEVMIQSFSYTPWNGVKK